MAKTTAPTMRQMPPVFRLRAASTAGPTRGPAAPASTVIVPSFTLLPSFPPISTGTSVDPGVIGAAAEGDGHRPGGRVDMPQSDRFADTRPGQMRTVRGTLLTEQRMHCFRCTVLGTVWLGGADLQSAMGTSLATTTVVGQLL